MTGLVSVKGMLVKEKSSSSYDRMTKMARRTPLAGATANIAPPTAQMPGTLFLATLSQQG